MVPPLALCMVSNSPGLLRPKTQRCPLLLPTFDPFAHSISSPFRISPQFGTSYLLHPRPGHPSSLPVFCPQSVPHSGLTEGPSAQRRARHIAGNGRRQVAEWREPVGRAKGDGAGPSTEQQAASKAQQEQELAATAFQELDDDMDGM